MVNNKVKTAQLVPCPHCGKEMYVTTEVETMGVTSTAKKDEVDKIKSDLVKRIYDGTFPRDITFEEKKEMLEWLTDPETVLMPQDVEEFLSDK